LKGSSITITVTATTDAFTIDRRYAEPVALPVAVAEVAGPGIVAASLPPTFASACRDDLITIDGSPVAVGFAATPLADLFAGIPAKTDTCDAGTRPLDAGEHIVRTGAGIRSGLDVDRIVLTSAGTADEVPTAPPVGATVISQTKTSRTVRVEACPHGCWFVFGEGYSTGWKATMDGASLGSQTQVDGGFNGWYLPPSNAPRTIHLSFTGQRTLVIGLVLTGLGLLLCIALVVFDKRRTDVEAADQPTAIALWGRPIDAPYRWTSPSTLSTSVAAVAGALVISPLWGLICAAVSFLACFVIRRPPLLGYAAVAIVAYIGLVMVHRVTSRHPFANAGWPGEFEDLHRLGMSVIVLLLASTIGGIRHRPPAPSAPAQPAVPAER